jgi:hypothetical protein
MMRGASMLAAGALVVAGIVAVGSINGGSDDYLDDYLGYPYPDYEPPDITVEEVADPYTGETDRDPSAGHRFVAIEVVVTQIEEDEVGYGYADSYYFKLTDSDGFAYPAIYEGAKPMLSGVDLAPGEKTRGWITFEVAQDNEIASLSYLDENVPLP